MAAGQMQRVTKKRILIVEDDAEAGRLLVRILEAEGYEVVLATDIDQAAAAAQEGEIDLALADIVLGTRGDGQDVYETLLEIQSGLRVIFMSGYGAPIPNDPVLAKPFKPSELLARVEQALNDRR
jgi:DNA-binding response OmpR family regulator